MGFDGSGFFDKDLTLACWYDQEVTDTGLYDEEFIEVVAQTGGTSVWLPLLGVG